jgi:hypothetical protein
MADLNAFRSELNRMANAQFDTPEFQRLLSVRFTLPRARFYIIHNAFYNKNGIVGALFLAPPPWM